MASAAKILFSKYFSPDSTGPSANKIKTFRLDPFQTSSSGTTVNVIVNFAASGWQGITNPNDPTKGLPIGYTLYISDKDISRESVLTDAQKSACIKPIRIGVFCNRACEHQACVPVQTSFAGKINTTYYMKIEADTNTFNDEFDFFNVSIMEVQG